uniref:Lipoprotein n=1 Tax=Mycoplasma feriruminatoris TaxID=1179777 RepID=A0A654III0_9MOLU|nr:hypothetical protein MF5295_00431 [Mycoplasma feriruminatoris]
MKKLLTILGSLTLITSGGALVVACNNKNTNTQANTKPETTPANSDKDGKQPSEGDKKPSDKEPDKDEKQPGDKDGKQPGKPAPKTPEKKPVKKPVNDAPLASANYTKLLFDDTMKQTLDAWTKSYKAKIEKAEKDKLNAILAAKAARDYEAKKIKELFDTFDRISDYEKDEAWVKAEKKRIDEMLYRESIEEAAQDKLKNEKKRADARQYDAQKIGEIFDDSIRIQLEKHKVEFAEKTKKIKEIKQLEEGSSNDTEKLFKALEEAPYIIEKYKEEARIRKAEKDFIDDLKLLTPDTTKENKDWKTRKELEDAIRRQKDKEDAAVSRKPRNKPTANGSDSAFSWLDGLNRNPKNNR